MEVTLHGGPHDGRRITIDPAVAARRILLVPDLVVPLNPNLGRPFDEDSEPIAIKPQISIYQRTTWMGERTHAAAYNQAFVRWQYTGHHQ